MKLVRNILLSPLTVVRLIIILLMSGYVTTIGWFWLKLFGFSRRMQQWVMQAWGTSIVFCLGIKINRNDLPKSNNFILMPNHRSYLDIFIIAALTPSTMVGKAEINKWPFMKLGVRVTNSILVDRKDSRSLLNTMKKIKESVKQGIPVTLFPEGTTHAGPLTKEFKNGSFKIAADSGIPVIPMAIDFEDKADAWIGDDTLVGHFFRQMGKFQTKVNIRYCDPISDNDYKTLQEKTKSQIDAMLTEIQNR
ncbi:lysophospholipid acyltransferase family protein [Prolixibacteraceae bacterium Z1-6]|uniref:1-acyl-sn-glycerol-3-phosphate acyltransferase n=1 Tax=Draconibacterium aestuarii TaxID=2998507 RepID=A0A9X3J5F0_9BACT|nr:lysophospholipid acyltransferase family protein [Prolixibacteraceae bacterium Z1-6]